jgi:hypothetical protein
MTGWEVFWTLLLFVIGWIAGYVIGWIIWGRR